MRLAAKKILRKLKNKKGFMIYLFIYFYEMEITYPNNLLW